MPGGQHNGVERQIRRGWRAARARWRAVRAAVWRVRFSLASLTLVGGLGTLIFWLSGLQPDPAHALVYVVNLMTLQAAAADIPGHPALQLASFAVAIGGLICLAGGAATLWELMRDPKQQQQALATTFRDHVVVCGVGNVGYRVIRQLVECGEDVVAVNQVERPEWQAELQAAGVPVILGDAKQQPVLREAGVDRAAAIVVCTSDDMVNLEIALDAREIHPAIRVVLRVFDEKLARKIRRGFDIPNVLSASEIAAPAFAVAAMRRTVYHSFHQGDQLLNVSSVTFRETSPFLGRTIEQVEQAVGCAFIGRETDGSLQMPPDRHAVLRAGDRLVVVASLQAAKQLER